MNGSIRETTPTGQPVTSTEEVTTLRGVAAVAAEAVELIGRVTYGLHDSHLPEIRQRYRDLLGRLPHPYAAQCADAGPKYCWLHGDCWCGSGARKCGMHPNGKTEVSDVD